MQPYTPDALPLVNLDYRLLMPLVGQATRHLVFSRLINLAEGREVI